MPRKIWYWGAHILVPLLVGGALYLLLCPDTLLSGWYYGFLGLPKPQVSLPEWLRLPLRNFGCDILWAYALTYTLSLILGQTKTGVTLTGGIGIVVECGVELLQNAGVIAGTFDLLDILLEGITTAFALSCIIYHFSKGRQNI